MKQLKAHLIKARVSTSMKRRIDDLAYQRGESEAVIVREALSQYLEQISNSARKTAGHGDEGHGSMPA
jgi:predicted DNA-binding protein